MTPKTAFSLTLWAMLACALIAFCGCDGLPSTPVESEVEQRPMDEHGVVCYVITAANVVGDIVGPAISCVKVK